MKAARKREDELRAEGESLRLSYTGLDAVPPNVLGCRNLVILDLSNNNIDSLPVEFCALRTLKILHLSYNNLASLPTNFRHLFQLEHLSLGGNQLTSDQIEQAGFDKFGSLTRLNLTQNKLSRISPSICECDALVHLALGGNEIEEIPDAVVNLKQLQYLGVDNNKLTTINKAIGKLPTLKGISIAGNPLTDQQAELVELSGVVAVIHSMIDSQVLIPGGSETAPGAEGVPHPSLPTPPAPASGLPAAVAITSLPDPMFPREDRFSTASGDSPSSLSSISESDRHTLVGDSPLRTEIPIQDDSAASSPTTTGAEPQRLSPLRTDISNFLKDPPPASATSTASSFSLDYYAANTSQANSNVGTPLGGLPPVKGSLHGPSKLQSLVAEESPLGEQ
ncbi:hypothetical protein DFJ77DRAFT_125282 [Powellomyces hirtus]|nr:hypothetical protein DFJ77DRAFT_125282 [Powellomyces hirtus]